MNLCVVAIRKAWKDEQGRWTAGGGLPMEMEALSKLFDRMTLVLTDGFETGGMPLPSNAAVTIVRQPTGKDFRRKFDVLTRLPHYLSKILPAIRKADAVYLPVPGDMPLIGLAAALLMRKRVIACYNGSWEDNSQTTRLNRLTKWIMRRVAGGRNIMFALGWGEEPPAPRMRWLFASSIWEEDLQKFRPELNRGLYEPARLAFVGRLFPEKGLKGLYRALGILKNERGMADNCLHLTLIGTGPEQPDLEQMAQKAGIQSWTTYVGQLDHDSVLNTLLTQDLLVFPSLSEGFGKARLDAMICGLPMITTAVGHGREFVGNDGDRGWIVPVANDQALAEQIEAVVTQPVDWPAMRHRCREWVEELTLEEWAGEIAQSMQEQWHARIEGGKIRL